MMWVMLLATVSIADFSEVTAGHYQVFAQSGPQTAGEVNGYMNSMLQLYSRYFSNWTAKEGARVVVFSELEDFRDYSRDSVGVTHRGVTGYCHLKTDEDGNRFYELVTFEHPGIWEVLAHEGFHQFIGYELGAGIPVWLNEGMAQYFESFTVKNGQLVPGGLDAKRLARAQSLINMRQAPSLAELLAMDRATFYANANTTYPMSWAMVAYLVTHRSSAFQRYLQDLKWNRPARQFGRESAHWQRDFELFIVKSGNFR